MPESRRVPSLLSRADLTYPCSSPFPFLFSTLPSCSCFAPSVVCVYRNIWWGGICEVIEGGLVRDGTSRIVDPVTTSLLNGRRTP